MFPVLALFNHNKSELSGVDLLIPVGFSMLFTTLLVTSFRFISRDIFKAALATTMVLLIFFSYGHLASLLHFRFTIANYVIGPNKLLMPALILLTILGSRTILRSSSNGSAPTTQLNLTGALLVAYFLAAILIFKIDSTSSIDLSVDKIFSSGEKTLALDKDRLGYKPDIYYIIFDQYAGAESLERYFDFRNDEIYAFLESKGFYVTKRSRANYPRTYMSLTSSLNMQYLNPLTRAYGERCNDESTSYQFLENNIVVKQLQNTGYDYIHIGSWFGPTRLNRNADININSNPLYLSSFSSTLIETTMLGPFAQKIWRGRGNAQHYTLYALEQLKRLPAERSPKFVFAHILCPHDPICFKSDGSFLPESEDTSERKPKNYIGQLEFVNQAMMDTVSNILAKSAKPPIIIIQSDEGPYIFLKPELEKGIKFTEVSQKALKSHMDILNAYYLPEFDQQLLFDNISPVNSFRLIFNYYFGTDYNILPNRSYVFQDYDQIYKFIDVSKQLD